MYLCTAATGRMPLFIGEMLMQTVFVVDMSVLSASAQHVASRYTVMGAGCWVLRSQDGSHVMDTTGGIVPNEAR